LTALHPTDPRRRPTAISLLAAATILAGATISATTSDPDAGRDPGPGMPAPLFSASRLDGGTLSLESLRGQVVLLNFWAPACPPCRIEMPEIQKIHLRHAGQGLRVIGITEMDPPPDQLRAAIAKTGVSYTIHLDPGARIGSLYALEAHPTSVVIDARGIMRYTNVGYLKGEEREIERAVIEALGMAGRRRARKGSPAAAEGRP